MNNKNLVVVIMVLFVSVCFNIYQYLKINSLQQNISMLEKAKKQIESSNKQQIYLLQKQRDDLRHQEKVVAVGHKFILTYLGNMPLEQRKRELQQLAKENVLQEIFPENHNEVYNPAYQPNIEITKNNFTWLGLSNAELNCSVTLSASSGPIKTYYEYEITLKLVRENMKWLVENLDVKIINGPNSDELGD